jgi:hypothetical protein
MSVKHNRVATIICIGLSIMITLFPGAYAQDVTNETSEKTPLIMEDDYIQGLFVGTPESVNVTSSEQKRTADTTLVKLAAGVSTDGPEKTGIEWQSLLGGKNADILHDIHETSDGGYIAVGLTNSADGTLSGLKLKYVDAWVVKYRQNGSVEWQNIYGGAGHDQGMSICEDRINHGYTFVGYSASNESEFPTHGNNDVWVVNLDNAGTVKWKKLLGGSRGDYGRSIRQTPDGSYIIAGNTFSTDIPNVSATKGGIYAAKLDASGNVLWQQVFGGSGDDSGSSIIPASDEGYILNGYSNSEDFGQSRGYYDIIVMKLDETTGKQIWLKRYGGSGYDLTGIDNSIYPTSDKGYVINAQTTSYNSGDVGLNHGSNDVWIVKLDQDGNLQWQKTYGGTGCDIAGGIEQLPDGGGYIFTSQAASGNSDDVSGQNYGDHDVWVVRLDPTGNILWEQLIGGNEWDQSTCIRHTTDGGYIFSGFTRSSGTGYVDKNHGYDDAWVVKLNPRLTVDVMDANTNEWVPNVMVTLHDFAYSEDQNLSALINGRVVFSDSGKTHQYRLVNQGKYSINATSDLYFPKSPVNIIYSGDGQRVIVNLTPKIANYSKSFSITCIEHYDHICGNDGRCALSGSFDECDNVASALSNASYKMNFYHKDGEVTEKDFATDSSFTGHNITESAFHYHSGHGNDIMNVIPDYIPNPLPNYSPYTFLPLKDYKTELKPIPVYPFFWPHHSGGYIDAMKVNKKWGGKTKWVAIQSCNILKDENWGGALTTAHGILGYSTSTGVNSSFPTVFLNYALDKHKNMTMASAYKLATRETWYSDNVTAKMITRTRNQYYTDQFPGVGVMAPDAGPNDIDPFIRQWKCRSDLEW